MKTSILTTFFLFFILTSCTLDHKKEVESMTKNYLSIKEDFNEIKELYPDSSLVKFSPFLDTCTYLIEKTLESQIDTLDEKMFQYKRFILSLAIEHFQKTVNSQKIWLGENNIIGKSPKSPFYPDEE